MGVGIALYGPYGLLKFGFHFWVPYSSVWWVKIVYRIFQGKNETIVVNLLSDGSGGGGGNPNSAGKIEKNNIKVELLSAVRLVALEKVLVSAIKIMPPPKRGRAA